MFSFGRKSSRNNFKDTGSKDSTHSNGSTRVENNKPRKLRSRPSLPQVAAEQIPWPEELIDASAIQQSVPAEVNTATMPPPPPPPLPTAHTTGAAKSSLSAVDPAVVGGAGTIPFHRPFRRLSDAASLKADSHVGDENGHAHEEKEANKAREQQARAPIYSWYMSRSTSNLLEPVPPLPPSLSQSSSSQSSAAIPPPVQPQNHRLSMTHSVSLRRSVRQQHQLPPSFNVMVVGAQGTGKTSLLQLLLETAEISPSATRDQRMDLDRFVAEGLSSGSTQGIRTACVEILESRFDRILFSVVDTPGLDFRSGKELRLERQVTGITKYIDAQYFDTLTEESKVVRHNKGDQHIHLCIYMIDPASIMTTAARRHAQSSLLTSTLSETTLAYYPTSGDVTPEAVFTSAHTHGKHEQEDRNENVEEDGVSAPSSQLTMSPAEIRVISRLATRVNLLPVIARADTLTDEQLAAAKAAVRRDLAEAKIGFGVFDGHYQHGQQQQQQRGRSTRSPSSNSGTQAAVVQSEDSLNVSDDNVNSAHAATNGEQPSEDDDNERRSRPVIKLRKRSTSASARRSLSRSRSRRSLRHGPSSAIVDDMDDVEDDTLGGDLDDAHSVANVRFSAAQLIARSTDLSALLPFTFIAPEHIHRRRARQQGEHLHHQQASRNASVRRKRFSVSWDDPSNGTASATIARGDSENNSSNGNEDDDSVSMIVSPASPTGPLLPLPFRRRSVSITKNSSGAFAPERPVLEDLKGVFVRKYRWGCIDVLNPEHCDFAALRTTVFTTHLKLLRKTTRNVMYEQYRTEKLLARRATSKITQEDTARLLGDSPSISMQQLSSLVEELGL